MHVHPRYEFKSARYLQMHLLGGVFEQQIISCYVNNVEKLQLFEHAGKNNDNIHIT